MVKLRITKAKAPWPEGAGVGDVVEMEAVPAWAVGKCEVVGEEAAVEGAGDGDLQARLDAATRAASDALTLAEEANEAMEQAQAVAVERGKELEAALAKLADAQAALDASRAEADELRKQLADAQAALAKATEPKAKK